LLLTNLYLSPELTSGYYARHLPAFAHAVKAANIPIIRDIHSQRKLKSRLLLANGIIGKSM